MRTLKKSLAVLGGAAVGVLLIAMPAFGGSISSPSNPWNVPDAGGGTPGTTDITVTGFSPGTQVYLEQCDGVSTSAPGWTPLDHCDNGTSPAAGITDSNGSYTFHASDSNHAFHPFKGTGPSGSFDCLSPHDTAPNDGMPQYRNCQLRVSTNNAATTADQSLIAMVLPDASGQVPEVPLAIVLPIGAIAIGGAFFLINKRRSARATA